MGKSEELFALEKEGNEFFYQLSTGLIV